MSKEKKKSKGKTQEEIFEEIKALAKRADETSNQQLDIFAHQKLGNTADDKGFDAEMLNDTANPDKSHKLYYAIRRLLMDYLPKGKEYKALRNYIYEEKDLFLNRGNPKNKYGIRNSDGRMTYIPNVLVPAFRTVAEWIVLDANPFDIYKAFWDLNEEKGYHKSLRNQEQQNKADFDKTLGAILKVPKPPKNE